MSVSTQQSQTGPTYGPGQITLNQWDDMPEDYRGMVRYLVGRQLQGEIAACELFARAVQYVDTPQQKVELTQTAMEEANHVQIVSELAPKIGIDMDELIRTRRPLATWFLGDVDDVKDWTELCVFKFLVDRAGNVWLWSMRDTSFKPYGDTMIPIMRDESRHQTEGARGVLAEIAHGRRELVQQYVNKWFPRAMKLLGRPQSKGNQLAHKYGLKGPDSEVEMRKYLGEIQPTITKAGLALPSPDDLRAMGIDIRSVAW
ncbi:MAG: Phenylacetic acid catabolic protein [Lautropia sp.]